MSSILEILCNTLARISDRAAACCSCRYAIERKKVPSIQYICITIEKQKKINWSQIHITTFRWVGIFVKTNAFLHFWKTSRVPLGKLPRTTSGTRTTGWEPLEYWVKQISYFTSVHISLHLFYCLKTNKIYRCSSIDYWYGNSL